MSQINPYTPSRASLAQATGAVPNDGGDHMWRDGSVLVTLPDAAFPDRCVKCNEPAEPPTKARWVYWHHPGLYALILLNLLIFIVVALIVRKKARVAAGLCAQHKKRRRTAIALSWTGALAGIAVFAAGLGGGNDRGALIGFVGVLAILASIVCGMVFARIVYPKKIDKSYVRLKGCGQPFLDSLPSFPN